ncbi:MAG: 50S ribosomal protein L23 [Campylobacterales bacterium]|nr:50S ribosomal protein L23 [Campylobacterales bacterium]
MATITDIKSILYSEKSLGLQEQGKIVVQTSTRVTKNSLKEIFKEYFGIKPVAVNSLRMSGKTKRFRGVLGSRADYKKFYVTLPEGAEIESLTV